MSLFTPAALRRAAGLCTRTLRNRPLILQLGWFLMNFPALSLSHIACVTRIPRDARTALETFPLAALAAQGLPRLASLPLQRLRCSTLRGSACGLVTRLAFAFMLATALNVNGVASVTSA